MPIIQTITMTIDATEAKAKIKAQRHNHTWTTLIANGSGPIFKVYHYLHIFKRGTAITTDNINMGPTNNPYNSPSPT